MAGDTETTTFPPPSMAGEPKGYGLSGKIMLSAIVILFAVVIIMVCLHIYARWYILRTRRRQIGRARRRTHLVFYVEPNNPSNIIPIPTRGLDASVLESLPTFTYRKGDDVEEREIGCLECAVCLSEFEEGEKGRVLPKCNHSFHVDCIDMWFHSHSTCPICRATVEGGDLNVDSEVPVELSVLTQDPPSRGPSSEERVGSSQSEVPCSSSVSARRKGLDLVGVSIEVPRRSQSFSFTNMDESGPSRSPSGFKSPTSRILSLKRILSREKKSPLPSPSGPGASCVAGESATEFDVELGGVEQVRQLSPVVTPR